MQASKDSLLTAQRLSYPFLTLIRKLESTRFDEEEVFDLEVIHVRSLQNYLPFFYRLSYEARIEYTIAYHRD